MTYKDNSRPLNILVIGTGAYSCGRGTDGYGTVMPAILEWKRANMEGRVYIAGRTPKSISAARRKISGLKQSMGVDAQIDYIVASSTELAVKNVSLPCGCIVVVPDDIHKKAAESAMRKSFHTLVVKPLAPTIDEVRDLISLQKKKNIHCAVEFHKRFDHANLKMKDVIAGGHIGDVLYFAVQYSQRKCVPLEMFKKWVSQTNVFQYLGIHYVDIIYFSTGAKPLRVMATGQKNWLASRGVNAYDAIQGAIEWKMPSGKRFASYILTGWIDPDSTSAMSEQKIMVVGTKGRFESDQKRRGVRIVTDENGVEEPNPYFCSPYGPDGSVTYNGYGIDSVKQFLDDVVAVEDGALSVAELEKCRPTFSQAVVPTVILEGINRSLKNNGRWVKIDGTAI